MITIKPLTNETEILEKAKRQLLPIPGVLGVGLSHSVVTGIGNEYQILVSIRDETVVSSLPNNIDGIPVIYKISKRVGATAFSYTNDYLERVREKEIQTQSLQTPNTKIEYRPVKGGISGGLLNSNINMTGTIGCFVKDNIGRIVILSNNHVFAWNIETFPSNYKGKFGDSIIQPGAVDGGNISHSIGTLEKWVNITSGTNRVDCAYIVPNVSLIEPNICNLYTNSSINPSIGLGAKKAGRTTGCVEGIVESINSSYYVDYVMNTSSGPITFSALFDDLITIRNPSYPTAQAGDSGSVWVTTSGNYAIGLTFAGDETGTAIACKSKNIESDLGVTFEPVNVLCNTPLLEFKLS